MCVSGTLLCSSVKKRAFLSLLQEDGDDRILECIVEFRGAPGLHDALARNELEIAPGDVIVPGRYRGADLVRLAGVASGHLGMGPAVEPGLVDVGGGCRRWCLPRGSKT